MDALDHVIDLLGKILAQMAVIFLRVLQQKDAGGDFHCHRIAVAFAVFLQPVGDGCERLAEALEIGGADAGGQFGTGLDLLGKWFEAGGMACAILVPGFFGEREDVAQAAQLQLLPGEGLVRLIPAGDLCREIENLLCLGCQRICCRRCLRHVVEGFAHDALGERGGAVEQTADLQVDARTELARQLIGGNARIVQGFQEGLGNPPEGAGAGSRLDRLDRRQRLCHGVSARFLFGRAGQPLEQAFLEIHALGT